MILTTIFAVAASAPLPLPLTQAQSRDIGCVAVVAILADEQRRGIAEALRYPNVQNDGRKWAGIVGDRITRESRQPREVIAIALHQAAKDERSNLRTPPSRRERASECVMQMQADLIKETETQAP
jgi:hypothetical protein